MGIVWFVADCGGAAFWLPSGVQLHAMVLVDGCELLVHHRFSTTSFRLVFYSWPKNAFVPAWSLPLRFWRWNVARSSSWNDPSKHGTDQSFGDAGELAGVPLLSAKGRDVGIDCWASAG